MRRIFVVGSINTDLVIKTERIPNPGETLNGNGFFTSRGGKGANQAVATSRLGGTVVMCACVGDDSFGESAVDSLKSNGIDVSHIRRVNGKPTGTAVITVCNGENSIILANGANESLDTNDIDAALNEVSKGDILLVQLENPIEVIGYAIKKAYNLGMTVILNPAPANINIIPFIKYCHIIIPNETEYDILGRSEIIKKNTSAVLITTLGSKGYEISTNEGRKSYKCISVDAVDTTAAGDTFCGGLAAKLAESESITPKEIVKASEFASLAASVACTRIGAQPSIPSLTQLDEFLT